jgi:hypothetical protein
MILPAMPTAAHRTLVQSEGKDGRPIIAGKLSKAGWSWGCLSAVDSNGRTIWIVDDDRGDGKRFVAQAEEKLTAFLELARMISTHLLTKDVEHP